MVRAARVASLAFTVSLACRVENPALQVETELAGLAETSIELHLAVGQARLGDINTKHDSYDHGRLTRLLRCWNSWRASWAARARTRWDCTAGPQRSWSGRQDLSRYR